MDFPLKSLHNLPEADFLLEKCTKMNSKPTFAAFTTTTQHCKLQKNYKNYQ
jgi:hypothetical protein